MTVREVSGLTQVLQTVERFVLKRGPSPPKAARRIVRRMRRVGQPSIQFMCGATRQQHKTQQMILKLKLSGFVPMGTESRLFMDLKNIAAVRSVRGVGRYLILEMYVVGPDKGAMRQVMALLRQYGMPLARLRAFAEAS